MSAIITGLVWELDLPRDEKYILLALADHTDHDGERCYPSVERVADMCGCSERTVQRKITKLLDRGLLEAVTDRTGGRGQTTRYRVDPRKGDKLSRFSKERATPVTAKGDTGDVKGDTVLSPDPLEPSDNRQAAFEDLWKLDPRGAKAKAKNQYVKAVPTKISVKEIHAARVAALAASEARFVTHLERWIRDGRWADVLPEPEDEALGDYDPAAIQADLV